MHAADRPVYLIHGLWMRSLSLLPLARRLHAAGFCDVRRFDYWPVRAGVEVAIDALAARLRAEAPEGADLVGHSLGGLVALQAACAGQTPPVRRIVCLGSPLRGSATASALSRWPIGPAMLGRCRELLQHGVGQWQGAPQVGVIAGTRPFGGGRLIHRANEPNDGTVAVSETRLPGLADHITLPTTHTGMLFSPPVARQVVAFLRDGRFEDPSVDSPAAL